MNLSVSIVFLLPLIFVNHAYAQEPIVMEQVTSDGSVKVRLVWPEVLPDEPNSFQVMFLDPDSNEPVTDIIWYIVNVRHPAYEEPIEHYEGSVLNGEKSFAVLFPEDATGPVQVVVLILGIADKRTGYDAVFNVHVVQEFASAQEPIVMEQATPNGEIKVQLTWPEVLPDQLYNIGVRFLDANTDQLLDKVTITYDVIVLQQRTIIEVYRNQNTGNGEGTFEVVFPQDGAGSAEVIIAVTSMTDNSGTVDMDETVSFNVQVVPEFPLSYGMVTVLSIILAILASRKFNFSFGKLQ